MIRAFGRNLYLVPQVLVISCLISISFAGHALLFHDDIVLKKDFNNFPTNQLTFEAWISTSDSCHKGTIMSYAINSTAVDEADRIRDFNHFVIFNPNNLLSCHSYRYIDLVPDYLKQSCHSSFNQSDTVNFVEASGKWHHLAVTWDGRHKGNTKIYKDGQLVAEAVSQTSSPIKPNGAFMLGADQDCFGGCTDINQGFYGLLDEVRIWNKVRSQNEIISTMRNSDVVNDDHLVAYWQFDDPDLAPDDPEAYKIARDSSKYGNDLVLRQKPQFAERIIGTGSVQFQTQAISFSNNYAMKTDYNKMPQGDFTVEFWARTSKLDADNMKNNGEGEEYAEFFSFASISPGDFEVGNDGDKKFDTGFIDDAIRIDRYMSEFKDTSYLSDPSNKRKSTRGSVSIHINANRDGNGNKFDNWIDYRVKWVDAEWHHLAATWKKETGETQFYFDGKKQVPFRVSNAGVVDDKDPSNEGVDPRIGSNTTRSNIGSLVLGQNQECYSGCFSPSKAYDGEMAVLRIWNKVLDTTAIKSNMYVETPYNAEGLVSLYTFKTYPPQSNTQHDYVYDDISGQHLLLGAEGPQWEYSSAPLTNNQGQPLDGLTSSASIEGYALRLNDRQVLMHSNFHSFPEKQITVEFWMWSTDNCRRGAPFSYAAGDYRQSDNAFLLFNYNSWGVSVMEDEGERGVDHDSGIAATDGRWHYVAVTWQSSTGKVALYQDGKLVWIVQRGKEKIIPSGGTLVIGREQDCIGGCFDSQSGAAGPIQTASSAEHGDQDFYGIIDEMRIWKIDLDADQIYSNFLQDLGITPDNERVDYAGHKDMVAYWKFDAGSGFQVQDASGHGHNLYILQKPEWIPVRWMQTKRAEVGVCGNGVVEAGEQCDDGKKGGGDGCDDNCRTEPGYYCNNLSPSICLPKDTIVFKASAQEQQNSGSRPHKANRNNVVAIVLVVLVVVAVGVVLVIKRDWLARQINMLRSRPCQEHVDYVTQDGQPLEDMQYSRLQLDDLSQQQQQAQL